MRRNLKLKYRDTFGRAALSETSFYGYFTPILFYSAFHTWETQAFPEDLSPHPLPHSEKLTQQIPLAIYFTNGKVYVSKLLSQEPKPCDNLEGEMGREAGGRRNREGASVCLRLTDSRMHGSNHRNTVTQLSTNLN